MTWSERACEGTAAESNSNTDRHVMMAEKKTAKRRKKGREKVQPCCPESIVSGIGRLAHPLCWLGRGASTPVQTVWHCQGMSSVPRAHSLLFLDE